MMSRVAYWKVPYDAAYVHLNRLTAPTCKICRLKDAQMRQQAVYVFVL